MKISKVLILAAMIPAAVVFAQGPRGGGRPGGGFPGGQPGGRPGGGFPGGQPGRRPGAVVIPGGGGQPGGRPGGPVVVPGGRPDPVVIPRPDGPRPGPGPAPVIVVPHTIEIVRPAEIVQEVVITPEPTVTVETAHVQTAVASVPVKAGDYRLVLLEDTEKDATPAICYKVGQEMKFVFSVDKLVGNPGEGKLFIKWKRSGDDGKTESGRAEISPEQAISLVTSIDRPGFVRIEASLEDEAGHDLKSVFDGGAGAELEKLAQAVPEPEDFDKFWAKQKQELEKVAALPEIKRIQAKQEGFDAYEVKVPCSGPRPVTGYLIIPSGAAAKSLPAKVHFQAYGVRDQVVPDGVEGTIYFDVNAHGIELSQPKSYYDGIRARLGHYAYDNAENKTPDTSYFRYMAARVIRAFDFIKTVTAWNGKDLGVIGYSQGGLQAAWAAGLVPEITHAEIGMPWCTDVGCEKAGRQRGTCPDYQPGLDYYDPVNFIRRAPETCLIDIVRAGLGDYVAQPSGVAVLFNNAVGPKRVIFYQNCAHAEPNDLSTQIVMRSEDWPEDVK